MVARLFAMLLCGFGMAVALCVAYLSVAFNNHSRMTGLNAAGWPIFLAGLVIAGIICEAGRMAGNLNAKMVRVAEGVILLTSLFLYLGG